MEQRITDYESKFQQLFEKLIYLKNNPKLEQPLDHLITQLEPSLDEPPGLLNLPIFTEWASSAVSLWWEAEITPPVPVQLFVFRLSAVLLRDETRFQTLNKAGYLTKLLAVTKNKQFEGSPSGKLRFFQVLAAVIGHKSGVEWVLGEKLHEAVICAAAMLHPEADHRESLRFICALVQETVGSDEHVCAYAVKVLLSPLFCNLDRSIAAPGRSEPSLLYLERPLRTVAAFLEHFLTNVFAPTGDFRVLHIFIKHFNLARFMATFVLVFEHQDLFFDIYKIIFIVQFLELYIDTVTERLTRVETTEYLGKIAANYVSTTQKCSLANLLKFCSFSHLFFKVIMSKLGGYELGNFGELRSLADRLIVFEVQPWFAFTIKHCSPHYKQITSSTIYNEFSEYFIEKFRKIAGSTMLRLLYSSRDQFMAATNLPELCSFSLDIIQNTHQNLSRNITCFLFQSLLYVLRSFALPLEIYDGYVKGNETLVLKLLQTITILLESHHFTWKDCPECITMSEILYCLITSYTWDADILIAAMNIVKMTVARYMTANLPLLVDSDPTGILSLIISDLQEKLKSPDGDVRSAALEVLQSFADVSQNSFLRVRKLLLDSKLPTITYKLICDDPHPSVQSTGLKCLQRFITLEEFARKNFNIEEILIVSQNLLLNSCHPSVRIEAAHLLTTMHGSDLIKAEKLENVYKTMSLSTLSDLHWAVKVAALGFWSAVVVTHLQAEGMCDGVFPEAIFSKKLRKIIALNAPEVRSRLQGVLEELSVIGCLHVLVTCVVEDPDQEVARVALEITDKLLDLLVRYEVKSGPTKYFASSPCSSASSDYDDLITPTVCWKQSEMLDKKVIAAEDFLQYGEVNLGRFISERKIVLTKIKDVTMAINSVLRCFNKRKKR